MDIIRPVTVVEVVPSDEPVVWRDVDAPVYVNPDPYAAPYRSDPVVVQDAFGYPVRPTSRVEDTDYYGQTLPYRPSQYSSGSSQYSSGSSQYRRPTSSYDDSFYDYYSRGPREYSSRDYNNYGSNPTVVVSTDGYVSDGYRNPSEYATQRDYDERYQDSSSRFSRRRHTRPYRSYDSYRYR